MNSPSNNSPNSNSPWRLILWGVLFFVVTIGGALLLFRSFFSR